MYLPAGSTPGGVGLQRIGPRLKWLFRRDGSSRTSVAPSRGWNGGPGVKCGFESARRKSTFHSRTSAPPLPGVDRRGPPIHASKITLSVEDRRAGDPPNLPTLHTNLHVPDGNPEIHISVGEITSCDSKTPTRRDHSHPPPEGPLPPTRPILSHTNHHPRPAPGNPTPEKPKK